MSRPTNTVETHRRKELRSKKRMKRGKGPQTRTPMKKRNAARKKKAYARDFGDKAAYVRSLPCVICHEPGPSDPHHHPTRAAGGTSKDLVPLCFAHHREVHEGFESFEARHGIDMRAKAARIEEWYHMDPQPVGF